MSISLAKPQHLRTHKVRLVKKEQAAQDSSYSLALLEPWPQGQSPLVSSSNFLHHDLSCHNMHPAPCVARVTLAKEHQWLSTWWMVSHFWIWAQRERENQFQLASNLAGVRGWTSDDKIEIVPPLSLSLWKIVLFYIQLSDPTSRCRLARIFFFDN